MDRLLGFLLFCIPLVSLLPSCSHPSAEKVKCLWFTADANFQRFSYKDSICYYLDKAAETGFNHIVVDVKGIEGALYDSRLVPMLTESHGFRCVRDWDYLQFFIDEARKRGLGVSASATVFPAGSPYWGEGPVYNDPDLKSLTCLEYKPEGMVKIEDDHRKVAAFMNPVLPESQEYALEMIREIISNYDLDGFCMDYCRYPDAESDFSEASRIKFLTERAFFTFWISRVGLVVSPVKHRTVPRPKMRCGRDSSSSTSCTLYM